MKGLAFQAMGTSWWVHCDVPEFCSEASRLVQDIEAELSRFLGQSALSRLNRNRRVESALLAEVVDSALRLRAVTGGAFDPTLGSQLVALGYHTSFAEIDRLAPVIGVEAPRPDVVCEGTVVRLAGEGELDLGGIAKGFTVDRVVDRLLELGAREVFVDGGGDIRGAGASFAIGVGDGLMVDSRNGAVATSSSRGRRWRDTAGEELHHVLDPRSGRPTATSIDTATVIAADAVTADALATALLVDPDAVLATLTQLGLHALARSGDGSWWMTPGAPVKGARPLAAASRAWDMDTGS